MFEGDLRFVDQGPVGLESLAEQRAARHRGRGPRAAVHGDGLRRDQPEQAADAGEHRGLAPHAQAAGEIGRLPRRLAPVASHGRAAGLA